MDALIRLITGTIVRGTIYRTLFRSKNTGVIIVVAIVAAMVYAMVSSR